MNELCTHLPYFRPLRRRRRQCDWNRTRRRKRRENSQAGGTSRDLLLLSLYGLGAGGDNATRSHAAHWAFCVYRLRLLLLLLRQLLLKGRRCPVVASPDCCSRTGPPRASLYGPAEPETSARARAGGTGRRPTTQAGPAPPVSADRPLIRRRCGPLLRRCTAHSDREVSNSILRRLRRAGAAARPNH